MHTPTNALKINTWYLSKMENVNLIFYIQISKSSFVWCPFHDTPIITLSMCVYVLSSLSFFSFVKSSAFNTMEQNTFHCGSKEAYFQVILDIQLLYIPVLFKAPQACPFLIFMSFYLDWIQVPKFLKSSTCFSLFPSKVIISLWLIVLFSFLEIYV